MDYLDLNVRIGPRTDENRYAVYARSQAIGEVAGSFSPPVGDDQLELFVLKVGLTRRGVRQIHSPEWRAAQDFGEKLFSALFSDRLLSGFIATHNEAIRQGKGVRVTLSLDAPELANYPWEFLYDREAGQFLSLFEDTPVVRYVDLMRPTTPLAVAPPLRILAVASSPKDFYPLDIAREQRNLSQALKEQIDAQSIVVDWVQVPTIDSLREQLLKSSYHIFHFIGHGGFDEVQQDGVLIFENEHAGAKSVSGERLAVLLGNHRTLRLAVLNACEGARTSKQDPFAGTAMTLMRTGNLPAVVAMQFEITDRAAIDFSRGFYSALAAGRPVDAAVGQGRQAVFADDNDTEWSTPVLYLRAADGRIFDIDASAAARDKAARERFEREQAEQARVAKEKAEAERLAAKKEQETERRVPAQTPEQPPIAEKVAPQLIVPHAVPSGAAAAKAEPAQRASSLTPESLAQALSLSSLEFRVPERATIARIALFTAIVAVGWALIWLLDGQFDQELNDQSYRIGAGLLCGAVLAVAIWMVRAGGNQWGLSLLVLGWGISAGFWNLSSADTDQLTGFALSIGLVSALALYLYDKPIGLARAALIFGGWILAWAVAVPIVSSNYDLLISIKHALGRSSPSFLEVALFTFSAGLLGTAVTLFLLESRPKR
ncbi:MAG: CHAT domain-containing protein [Rudaea sp.]